MATSRKPSQPKLRVAPYLRASKDRYGQQKSVTDQATDYDASFKVHSGEWVEVDRFVDNDRSASPYAKKEREDFERLKAAIAADEIDVMWLWEFSRSQRRLKTYAELAELCRSHGVKWYIHTAGRLYDLDNAADRTYFGFNAVMAEAEADILSERSRRGVRANLAAGKPHGQIPYGYRRIHHEHTGMFVRQEEDPVSGPIVKEIFARYASGDSLNAIALDLDARKVPRPIEDAKRWYPGSIKRIALSPVYLGKRVYGPRGKQKQEDGTPYPLINDAQWPALVEADIFEQCKQRSEKPQARKWTRGGKAKHLLSGVMACGTCGGRMSPANIKYRGSTVQRYVCRDVGCAQLPMDEADRTVVEAVLRWLGKAKVGSAVLAGYDSAKVRQARNNAAEARQEYEETYQLWDDGKLSPTAFARKEPGLLERIAKTESIVASLTMPGSLAALLRGKGSPRARWEALELPAKREVVRSLWVVEALPVGKGNRFTPDKVRMIPR